MRFARFTLTLIFAFFSLQAAGADAPKNNKSIPIKKIIEIGKKGLAEKLKDPPSARFMELMITEPIDKDKQLRSLCGKVNAKNSFGGYGEPELFFVDVNPDGSTERVWLYDDGKHNDMNFVERHLYKTEQFEAYESRCKLDVGKAKMIWKGN